MTTASAHRLVRLDPDGLTQRLAEAIDVYVRAMDYPPVTARHRRSLWLEHAARPGWRAVCWLDPHDVMLGVAYGYTGGPGQWWYEEVRRGVRRATETGPGTGPETSTGSSTGSSTAPGTESSAGPHAGTGTPTTPASRGADPAWLADYFELTELHVRPDAQGSGLGEGLMRALLDGVTDANVLLSTPEHLPGRPSRAWRLYRRAGFRDVLRAHRFTGDTRPFAVLGRPLPLDDAPEHPLG